MLQKLKSHKFTISILLIVVDAFALLTASVIAYNFRFRSTLFESEVQPSIATIDYELILGFVIMGWLLTFSLSGIYRLDHDSLFILNVQNIIKRSLFYFFSLGFLSFVLRASFSRTVFIILLLVGLTNLVVARTISKTPN
jgi:hypothetical protein